MRGKEVATATTRLMPMHISKGQTIAQSLKDRFDYGENPDKTNGGELISAYECDPLTADAEFLLAKAKYKAITGREQKTDSDVITYQIRQSFRPGEITPEDANRLGYELAMRWTKGRHAFFVATHVDKSHIHSHIYYNSTSLDCTRKFRNFLGSTFAVRRISDRLCLENGLSIVADPKPHSKTQFKHYGEWFTGNRPLNFQDRLKIAIDAALAQSPADFAAFLSLMGAAGYEVKQGRGATVSFRTSGQERFTRLRASTLGDGYGPEDIKAAISGTRKRTVAPARKVNLLVDIQAKLKAGKGPGYERWAKIFNLKQMAAALAYLQDNGLTEYGQLEQRATEATEYFHKLMEQLKTTEAAMSTNAELKAAIVKYAKTRPVFEAYKAARYSKKFLAEHEVDIGVYRAVRADFERLLHGEKLPRMDALKEESHRLADRKKELYAEYRKARNDMQEVLAAKANIDYLLGYIRQEKTKQQER